MGNTKKSKKSKKKKKKLQLKKTEKTTKDGILVYIARSIGVGESQHVPNPTDAIAVNTITLEMRPSSMTLKEYYDSTYLNIRVPHLVEQENGNIVEKGYKHTIFEDFVEFRCWTPFGLYEHAVEHAHNKVDEDNKARNRLSNWLELAEDNVVDVLY